MRTIKNRLKRSVGLLLVTALTTSSAFAEYDVIERYTFLEDKFKTHDSLNAVGHDFYLELGGLFNKNLFDVIDEGEEIDKTAGGSAAKITAAQAFLRKYDKTEQNVRAKVGFGFPLPSFTIQGVKLKPNFRVGATFGVLMGIRTKNADVNAALEYVSSGLDPAIRDLLKVCNFSVPGIANGGDIIQYGVDNCGVPAVTAAPFLNKFFFPDDTTVPVIYNYVKGEGKAGFYIDYTYEDNWYGSFNLYGMGRADAKVIVTDTALAGQGEIAEFGDELNTTVTLSTDLKFGYKNKDLKAFLALEEVKLATMSDNKEKAGETLYGNDMLIRLQGEYIYNLGNFRLNVFGGLHHRGGYSFGKGYYLGTDLLAHVWEERLKWRVRGMIDNEHITFSPMMDLWFLNLEYALKLPIQSEVDGVKPSTLHVVNLRLEF
ncbi:hypothetical protein A9Q84_02500 [Halobacteriovorax marinus]|uniref:Uncharacterized protein n=1 Tax=Halobacteriovorax marinus TaxID=97084 RepID=A0A1Y5FD18_9BACT|nr:hypothetical protein A9Q84_02500 [Halobacteriovorax marinus]